MQRQIKGAVREGFEGRLIRVGPFTPAGMAFPAYDNGCLGVKRHHQFGHGALSRPSFPIRSEGFGCAVSRARIACGKIANTLTLSGLTSPFATCTQGSGTVQKFGQHGDLLLGRSARPYPSIIHTIMLRGLAMQSWAGKAIRALQFGRLPQFYFQRKFKLGHYQRQGCRFWSNGGSRGEEDLIGWSPTRW